MILFSTAFSISGNRPFKPGIKSRLRVVQYAALPEIHKNTQFCRIFYFKLIDRQFDALKKAGRRTIAVRCLFVFLGNLSGILIYNTRHSFAIWMKSCA